MDIRFGHNFRLLKHGKPVTNEITAECAAKQIAENLGMKDDECFIIRKPASNFFTRLIGWGGKGYHMLTHEHFETAQDLIKNNPDNATGVLDRISEIMSDADDYEITESKKK